MRADLFEKAAELARRGEAFAVALVVRREPASSAREGDLALVTADGGFTGWLGGACTRPTVVREAQRSLADGKPRLLALSPDPQPEPRSGVIALPMTCHSGGSVEIYIEPILPAPCLALFGDSPIASALAELGRVLGYAVVPGAQDELAGLTGRRPLFAVVATMGEDDEGAIRQALSLGPAYLGVVASARRFAQVRETLLGVGVSEEALAAIRCPAGLSIGARTPEEIAIAVLAEVVERRQSLRPEALAPVAEAPVAASEAIDPICGMTVEIAKARHTAEHAGRTWYFCCGGCRERFLAAPEKYLAAEAST